MAEVPFSEHSYSFDAIRKDLDDLYARQGIITPQSFGAKGDNATDDVAAFLAFRAWAMAFNTNFPDLGILLEFQPNGRFLCSNGFIFNGINNLTVRGNNSSLTNINSNFNDAYISFYLGGYGFSAFLSPTAAACGLTLNQTAYPIATAIQGVAAVTCLTPANASNMVPGNWALVGCNFCFTGNPPGIRFFDYVKIVSVNPGSGLVTFDRKLTNTYPSTLPSHVGAGALNAAFIFPFQAGFGMRQKYKDFNIQSSPFASAANYVFMQGEYVEIEGGVFGGGIDPSQLINGLVSGAQIAGVASGFEIDHWVNSVSFRDCNIGSVFDVNTAGSAVEVANCIGPGIKQCGSSIRVTGCRFGTVDLTKCLYGTFENNYPCAVTAWPTTGVSQLVVDGTIITYAAGIITIPQSSINYGSPNPVTQFLFDIWNGAVADIVMTASGFTAGTGGFVKILSITDDVTNVYLTLDVMSLTVTAVGVNAGGTSYAVGNTITLANGIVLTVATLNVSAVATVTITQQYAQKRSTSAVAQTSTSGSGSGATFDLTYGVPNGTQIAAPNMISYSGKNNIGGETSGFTVTDAGNRVLSAFPNGDVRTISGGKRTALIAPVSGDVINYQKQICRGYLKQITINVLRAFTGAQYGANALFLNIVGVLPYTTYPYIQINLSIIGQRQITPFGVTGIQSGDVAKAQYQTTMDQIYNGAYAVNIGPNYVTFPALTDATSLQAIIELDIEFEDMARNVPW
jgi:hypothetical protein